MPYVRKKKYTKRARRRTKNTRQVFRLQKQMPVGFPKTNAVKLRYVTYTTLDSTTGSLARHWFRANSAFDPDSSGVGHQPSGYDQWSQFYNHYVIVGSRMKATFSLTGTTDSGGIMICGINLSDDTSATTDPLHLLEQSHTRRKTSYYSVSGGKPTVVTKGFSAKKFFNVTNITDNWARLGANIAADPNEVAFFGVFVGNANGVIDPPQVTILIEIEYICIFSEPKELAES